MDAAAATVDADLGKSFGFFISTEEEDHPTIHKQRNTVIKFTRIPTHEFVNKVSWMQPRIRRITSLDDQLLQSPRSMKTDAQPHVLPSYTQRKIATIEEDDEHDLHPNFYGRKASTARSNRAVQVQEAKQARSLSNRTTTAVTSAKYSKEMKPIPKLNNALTKKDSNIKKIEKNKNINVSPSRRTDQSNDKNNQTVKEKVTVRSSISNLTPHTLSRANPRARAAAPAPPDKILLIKNKLKAEQKPTPKQQRLKENMSNKSVDIIRVPIESRFKVRPKQNNQEKVLKIQNRLIDNATETESRQCKDAEACTDLVPVGVDKGVYTGDSDLYDSLNIPNVSLKQKSELVNLISKSLPDLKVPNDKLEVSLNNSNSYIIGQATLTYTTKKKINIHVVKSDPFPYPVNVLSVLRSERTQANDHCNKLSCTDVIGSIRSNKALMPRDSLSEQFERELNFIDSFLESLQYLENSEKCKSVEGRLSLEGQRGKEEEGKEFEGSGETQDAASRTLCLLNLLIRDEQRRARNLLFVLKMREDALKDFTKSQILYLENKKRRDNTDVPSLKKKQRGALLKLQHECGEMQRMRKALITLSEKRKAALFRTKKSIEAQLQNVSVDKIISAKKKSRKVADRTAVAPLKCFDLSSSCDEMPRERNASEGPPPADHCVSVDGAYLNILFQNLRLPQIFSAGKQYEVNEEALRNILKGGSNSAKLVEQLSAGTGPELVGVSGGEASSASTARSLVDEFDHYYRVLNKDSSARQDSDSAETASSIETEGPGARLPGPLPGPPGAPREPSLDSLAWRTVSGASDSSSEAAVASTQITTPYTLESIPSIQEYALDITTSVQDIDASLPCLATLATCPNTSSICLQTSTPCLQTSSTCLQTSSTGLQTSSPYLDSSSPYLHSSSPCLQTSTPCLQKSTPCLQTSTPCVQISTPCVQTSVASLQTSLSSPEGSLTTLPESTPVVESSPSVVESLTSVVESLPSVVESLPSVVESLPSVVESLPSVVESLPSVVDCEAERLRRQQLAIEREIKALEQQQNQLLIVREIPDKPPPPYTAPGDPRSPAPRRKFLPPEGIEGTEHKVQRFLEGDSCEGEKEKEDKDDFEAFLSDYCREVVEGEKAKKSDKPWDAYNLLPRAPAPSPELRARTVLAELTQLLEEPSANTAIGHGSRRIDQHIEDILLAEWRMREVEWTTLHADEPAVKNQIFDAILDGLITETVDEYKKIFSA